MLHVVPKDATKKYNRMDTTKTVKLYELLKECLKKESDGTVTYIGKYDDSVVGQIVDIGPKTVAYHRVKLFGRLISERAAPPPKTDLDQKIDDLTQRVAFLERELGINK